MKLLAQLVPRRGAEAAVATSLDEIARALTANAGVSVASLWRVERDPFGPKTPYRGALELRAGEGADAAALIALSAGLAQRFGAALDPSASTALVGEEHVLIAAERAPVRYQYLMRRRADFSHEAYLARYREVHAQFGLRTPGILGYVQVHVDPAASRRAAEAAGFGACDVDSVSELHLASLGEFLRAVSASPIGAEAVADEERFVDRARSFDFCSRVTWPGGG